MFLGLGVDIVHVGLWLRFEMEGGSGTEDVMVVDVQAFLGIAV